MELKVSGNLEEQSDKAMKQAFPRNIKKIGMSGGSEGYLPERPFQKDKDPDIKLGSR